MAKPPVDHQQLSNQLVLSGRIKLVNVVLHSRIPDLRLSPKVNTQFSLELPEIEGLDEDLGPHRYQAFLALHLSVSLLEHEDTPQARKSLLEVWTFKVNANEASSSKNKSPKDINDQLLKYLTAMVRAVSSKCLCLPADKFFTDKQRKKIGEQAQAYPLFLPRTSAPPGFFDFGKIDSLKGVFVTTVTYRSKPPMLMSPSKVIPLNVLEDYEGRASPRPIPQPAFSTSLPQPAQRPLDTYFPSPPLSANTTPVPAPAPDMTASVNVGSLPEEVPVPLSHRIRSKTLGHQDSPTRNTSPFASAAVPDRNATSTIHPKPRSGDYGASPPSLMHAVGGGSGGSSGHDSTGRSPTDHVPFNSGTRTSFMRSSSTDRHGISPFRSPSYSTSPAFATSPFSTSPPPGTSSHQRITSSPPQTMPITFGNAPPTTVLKPPTTVVYTSVAPNDAPLEDDLVFDDGPAGMEERSIVLPTDRKMSKFPTPNTSLDNALMDVDEGGLIRATVQSLTPLAPLCPLPQQSFEAGTGPIQKLWEELKKGYM